MYVNFFGSCRVSDPLKILNKLSVYDLKSRWWRYTHTTQEINQIIDLLENKKTGCEEILALADLGDFYVGKYQLKSNRLNPLIGLDLLFLEVSSLSFFEYKGWYFQKNRLKNLMSQYGKEFENWFDDLKSGLEPNRLLKSGDTFTDDIISHCKFTKNDSATLSIELTELVERLRKLGIRNIAFVNHIDIEFDCGRIPERKLITETLYSFCANDNNLSLIDTSILINQFKRNDVLIDSTHYKIKSLPMVAEYFKKNVESFKLGNC